MQEEEEVKSLTHAHKHMKHSRNLHAPWCVFVYRTISLACLMKNSPGHLHVLCNAQFNFDTHLGFTCQLNFF